MTPEPTLTASRCPCGGDVFAVRPGVVPIRLDAIGLFTRRDKAVEAGRADVCWCRTCWSLKFGRRVA